MNNVGGFNFYQNTGMVGDNIRKFSGKMPDGDMRPDLKKDPDDRDLKNKKTENTSGVYGGVELSDGAKKILEELKEKYGQNTDFFVANYSTEEEAQEYLSRGTKDYSVLIEPELLEEMARDNEAKEKYMGIIENGTKQLDDMKEQLKEAGKDGEVKNIGFSVNQDGTLSFFAQLEQSSKAQEKRIAERREENKEKAAKETEKRDRKIKDRKDVAEQVKRATVKAETTEQLIEKIRNFEWEAVRAEQKIMIGSKVDFTA